MGPRMRTRAANIAFAAGLLVAFVLSGLPASADAQASKEAPIAVSSLSHPNTSVQWGRAVGVVEAPIDDVVQMVEDYSRYHTFLPHFRTSKVLTQRGASAIVYMEALVAMDTIKLWAQMKMARAAGIGNTRVIEAKMMKGNMNILEARWELTPIDADHTKVAFQLLIEPNVPLPSSVFTNENAKASRKTISALRKTLAASRKTARL